MVPALLAQIAGGPPAKFSIDERQDIVPRLGVTPPPGPQETAGRAGSICHILPGFHSILAVPTL